MDVPAALNHLATAGIDRAALLAELKVTSRTVQRWMAGNRPSRRNHTRLAELVDDLLRSALAEDCIASHAQVTALQAARDALLTDAQRAEVEALAASGRRPVTSYVDAFALCLDEPALRADLIDLAFAA